MTDTLPIEEFRSRGYLQEVNRRFFHMLGLALSVVQKKDNPEPIYRLFVTEEQLSHIETISDELSKECEYARQEGAQVFWLGDILQTDDPEGFLFGEFTDEERARAIVITNELSKRARIRERIPGFRGVNGAEGLNR